MTDPAAPPEHQRHAAAQPPDSPVSTPLERPPRLILASASPRRSALLRDAGYAFETRISNVDESEHPSALTPEGLVRYLAERKARTVAAELPDAVVLGADTVVAVQMWPARGPTAEPVGFAPQYPAVILGKPIDRDDARRILSLLSGTTHTVITAVAVIRIRPAFAEIAAVHSTVHMRPLAPAELDAYLDSEQWQGKAGAYGIQDDDPFVTAITGCTTNIVGLPMTTARTLLARAGVQPGR